MSGKLKSGKPGRFGKVGILGKAIEGIEIEGSDKLGNAGKLGRPGISGILIDGNFGEAGIFGIFGKDGNGILISGIGTENFCENKLAPVKSEKTSIFTNTLGI